MKNILNKLFEQQQLTKAEAKEVLIQMASEKKMPVKVKNLGKNINTNASEYVPLLSADESKLIFTYKGQRSTGGLHDGKGKKAKRR